jgi:cytochrome c biogenesis protein CcmG, thiol:disulfide interchange protein DsbE
VTLLHFWGTWCPPCKLEYPELAEMVQAMQSEPRFRFVSVSCGGGGGEDFATLQEQTASYYQSIGAGDLETFADLSGQTRHAVSQQLNESVVYPTTLLIDADQRIAGVWLGYSPAGVSEMRQAAERLLRDSL